jgi:hypothetical protein
VVAAGVPAVDARPERPGLLGLRRVELERLVRREAAVGVRDAAQLHQRERAVVVGAPEIGLHGRRLLDLRQGRLRVAALEQPDGLQQHLTGAEDQLLRRRGGLLGRLARGRVGVLRRREGRHQQQGKKQDRSHRGLSRRRSVPAASGRDKAGSSRAGRIDGDVAAS